jgi:hypothetical protein
MGFLSLVEVGCRGLVRGLANLRSESIYLVLHAKAQRRKVFWFGRGFDGLGGLETGVANGRSRIVYFVLLAKAQRRKVCLVLPRI